MEILLQDLRYGVRMMLKSPGYTLLALLALALGIGANSAIFSVVNSIMLRPLPYNNPDRLVTVWENHKAKGGPEREWTNPPTFNDWREQNQSFEFMAAYTGWAPTLTGQEEPERIVGQAVSHSMFQVLGTEPFLGRSFRVEEDRQGTEKVVVLSHRLWQRRFGSDKTFVGRTIALNGESYTVLGIMPEGFKFPGRPNVDIWTPLEPVIGNSCGRGCYTIRVIGRLKPGVSLEQARSEMGTIANRLAQQYPESNKEVGITIAGLHDQLIEDTKPALLVLLGAVAFVLLIACANVANLALARAATREKEIAIRLAIGAGRWRLIRQLLTENLLIALIGGGAGLLLAFWMVDLLTKFSPTNTPRLEEIGIDWQVLGFTIGISILTGLIFGLIPATQATSPDLNESLKEGDKGSRTGPKSGRIRNLLVVTETSLALILLICAGLLMKSFLSLQRVDPGLNPNNVLTMSLSLPRSSYPERSQLVAFYNQLLERVKSTPGVDSTGVASTIPLGGSHTDTSFLIEGRAKSEQDNLAAWYSSVSPDYFRSMGMRILKGRQFTEQDTEKALKVIIINETMAKRYWPGEDPVGKRLKFESGENWREIVGIMADVKEFGLDTDARPSLYFPYDQQAARSVSLVVRTTSDPSKVAGGIRKEIWSIDKNLAISNQTTLEEMFSDSISIPRFIMLLIAIFASLALILAAVGIYGVISYMVAQRTHEIGIRMALGADRGDILRMVLGQGMKLALIGIILGIGGAIALTRIMSSLLYGVNATDPVTFIGVSFLLAAVALMACYIPARKATKVDPMVALRYE
jgi:putative ABC transport system permease protein